MKQWTVGGGLSRYEALMQYYGKCTPFPISAVYDTHTALKWNGGRLPPALPHDLQESINRVGEWNQRGINFHLTFNNTLLTEAHLSDPDGNAMLEACYRPGNGVIIASDVLRDYVKANYPNYTLIASTCRVKQGIDDYKDALQDYDLVVVNPDHNRNLGLFRALDASRLEVMVNEFCIKNCNERQSHYDITSRIYLEGRALIDKDYCQHMNTKLHGPPALPLTLEEVDTLEGLGVQHFKIQGREDGLWMLQPYIDYHYVP